MALQLLGEDLGHPGRRRTRRTHREGTGRPRSRRARPGPPDVLVHLDDERRIRCRSTGTRGSAWCPTRCCLDVELERLEDEVGPEPHELVVATVEAGTEHVGIPLAHLGVDAVGGERRGRTSPRSSSTSGAIGAEVHVDAELGTRACRSESSSLRLMAAKPWPPTVVPLPVERGCRCRSSGRTAGHLRRDARCRRSDPAERLVGEHHPEPEGVVGGVALPHGHLVGGVELLHQGGEVEAARASADHAIFMTGPPKRQVAQLEVLELAAGLRGSWSTKRTSRGYLYGASVRLDEVLDLAAPWRRRRPRPHAGRRTRRRPSRGRGRAADDRALDDVRVGVDGGLDLGAADVVAGGDDHVVGAAPGSRSSRPRRG